MVHGSAYCKSKVIRRMIKNVKEWARRNSEKVNYLLYPDCGHDQENIHWHGLLRVSSEELVERIRDTWCDVNGPYPWSYSITLPKTLSGALTYCTKLNRQERCTPVVGGWRERLIISSPRVLPSFDIRVRVASSGKYNREEPEAIAAGL
jgi:hypothetical protein